MTGFSITDKPLYSVKDSEVIGIDSQIENAEKRLKFIRSQATIESLPIRWQNADFDKSIEGWEVAKEFAENFPNDGKGIMFLGGVGRGKTHLAGAIARYVIENHHVPVMFKSYAMILEEIKINFEGDKKELERVCNTPLLVMDDLGQEKQSDWNKEILFKIINSRYESMSPIVVTTNCTPMSLQDNIGEAIFSRLFEMCDKVKVSGKDHRKEK